MKSIGAALALLLDSIIVKRGEKRGAKPKEPEKPAIGEAPPAADYRIEWDKIDHLTCIARVFDTKEADKRWSKSLYREKQCGGKRFVGHELCDKCLKRKSEAKRTWYGVVTEEPTDTCRMPDTRWFIDSKVTWRGWMPDPKEPKEKKAKAAGSGASVVETATIATTVAAADEEEEEEELTYPEEEATKFMRATIEEMTDLSSLKHAVKETIKHLDATLGGAHEEFKDQLKALAETVGAAVAAERAAAAEKPAEKPKKVKAPKVKV